VIEYRFQLEWFEEVERGRTVLVVSEPQVFDNFDEAVQAHRRARERQWVRETMHQPRVGPIIEVTGGRPRCMGGKPAESRAQVAQLKAMLAELAAKKKEDAA